MHLAAQDISFNIEHDDTDELAFGTAPTVLPKGASKAIIVCFAPTSRGPFHVRVPVEINGLYNIHIDLKATVVARSIELLDKSQLTLSFGSIRVGKARRCTVHLMNRAPIPVTLDFGPAVTLATSCGVHIEKPTLQLAARQKGAIILVFKPKARLPAFTEAVHAKVAGVETPLLAISGAALGLEVKLDTNTLPFGTIVLGSSTTRYVKLVNSGKQLSSSFF
jgi:hydrocephalus-inducing protein